MTEYPTEIEIVSPCIANRSERTTDAKFLYYLYRLK